MLFGCVPKSKFKPVLNHPGHRTCLFVPDVTNKQLYTLIINYSPLGDISVQSTKALLTSSDYSYPIEKSRKALNCNEFAIIASDGYVLWFE